MTKRKSLILALSVALATSLSWAESTPSPKSGADTKKVAAAGQKRATAAEAKALADKALAAFKKDGVDASMQAFWKTPGDWMKNDVGLIVATPDGQMIVHADVQSQAKSNPYRTSYDSLSNVSDITGKNLLNEVQKIDKAGWVDLAVPVPLSSSGITASFYVARVPDQKLLVLVGPVKK